MFFKRRVALFLCVGGFVLAGMLGCSSSGPQVGEVESTLDREDQIQEAERQIAEDSTDLDAYFLKARLLRQKADSSVEPEKYIDLYRQAWELEEKAIAIAPEVRPDVERVREKVYTREKERGEKAYNRGGKNEDPALFRRAIGFFGAAGVTQVDSAAAVRGEGYSRLRVGQRNKAQPVLEEYVERADTVERRVYRMLGQLYVSNGDIEKAQTLLDQGIRTYPNDQSLQALRLNAYNRAGDLDEALAAYREQVERTPDRATYRYNYGSLLLKANRYGEAIKQLDKAIALEAGNAEGQYNLGAAYLNAALARDDSIAAIEQDSSIVQGTLSAAEYIDRLAEKRQELFEQAISPLERARGIAEEKQRLQRKDLMQIRQDACRALLVAYVQTDRPNRAAKVENCTGFARKKK